MRSIRKCKSLLLLLSVMWAVCSSTLESRDLLACEYNPSERTVSGRLGTRKISVPAMYSRYKKASNYDDVHTAFKALIEQNRNNYRYMAGQSLLYLNEEDGFGLYESGGKIWLYRTRVFADDAAWTYQKEPAINPQTDRPWIELSASELRSVNRGNKVMDEADQEFLRDVLSILNENFHYYYGMQLVDLGRDPEVDPAQLMGKFHPVKFFLFDEQVDMLNLSNYSAQQADLYRTLGHPVYNYEGLIHPEMNAGIGSTCGGKGMSFLPFKDDTYVTLIYFNQACPNEVDPSLLSRAIQFYDIPFNLNKMMEGLERLCEERGVNLRSQSANKTPLARALYLVYKKTDKYVKALVSHEYVQQSKDTHALDEGVNHVYDVIPIKGLYEARSSSRSSSRTSSRSSSKTRTTSSRTVRRNQSASRERN